MRFILDTTHTISCQVSDTIFFFFFFYNDFFAFAILVSHSHFWLFLVTFVGISRKNCHFSMISSFQMKLWNTRNPMVPVPSKAMAHKSHNFHLKLEIWKWKLNSNDLCQTLLFSGEVEVITSDFWLLIFGLFQHVICLEYSKFYEKSSGAIRFDIGSAKLKLFNKTCLFWNMESYSSIFVLMKFDEK